MKILLALDDNTATAQIALELASLYKASLTVFFVMEATWDVFIGHDWLSASNSKADFLEWMKDQEHAASDRALAQFETMAKGFADVSTEIAVGAGDVCAEVLRLAGAHDLLVISNPFRRGLGIVRDTSKKLTAANPCSLFFVKTEEA